MSNGADDFLKLSKALKNAGQKDLRKELHNAMKKAAKPLIPDARAAALARLPQRGGLAKRVAKQTFTVQVRTAEKLHGVRVARPRRFYASAQLNDKGVVRHPVHAKPGTTRKEQAWRTQPVPAAKGWFDEAMKQQGPQITQDVIDAMETVARKIAKEVKRG